MTELFPFGEIVSVRSCSFAVGDRHDGRIVQGALKGKLCEQVAKEIADLQAKGKIAEDFADVKYGFKSWIVA